MNSGVWTRGRTYIVAVGVTEEAEVRGRDLVLKGTFLDRRKLGGGAESGRGDRVV